MFEHEFLPSLNLKRIDTDNGRFYELPSGEQFRSVTTILSSITEDKINEWKKRVGENEAKKVSTQASRRGTAIHDLCEQYLLNNKQYKRSAMPVNVYTFNKLKPYLDKYVNTIYGLEHMMYSRKYKCAGTSDLICLWDGIPSIVDFKTSRYEKTKEMILSYFLQSTMYSYMVKELYDMDIKQIVILMVVDNSDVLIFKENPIVYYTELDKVFL